MFALQNSEEQKGRRADPGASQSQEKSAQEKPRVSADSAADGGPAEKSIDRSHKAGADPYAL